LRNEGLSHKVSSESESVGNDPSLRKLREFWLPNGYKAYFENHIKIARGYRIHFFPNKETKSIYVGYIGKHLKL